MNKDERELFRQALAEAFVRKYERDLAECRETAQCSDEHIRRINEIIRQNEEMNGQRNRRAWLVALLVAATLLLMACTAYAYHEEIKNFVEKVYEDYIKVTYDEEIATPSADVIVNHYTLGYVPDGYVSTVELYLTATSRCEWKNSNGDYLFFEQCVLDSTSFSLDVEAGETTVITYGDYIVYCRISDTFTYIWNDGFYSFSIISSKSLSEDTFIRILEGMKIVE